MATPPDPAVKKLKELASELDKASATQKSAIAQVAKAREKAARAAKLIARARRSAGKKR